MQIIIEDYKYPQVLSLLKELSPQFTPPLSDSLDLEIYAEKLANNATFLTYNDDGKIKGVIVFYPNKLTSILYIPLVWVFKKNRGGGIAKKMFGRLIDFGKEEGFSSLDLEVLKDNEPANHLYCSLGFSIIEDRRVKYLMRLNLRCNKR